MQYTRAALVEAMEPKNRLKTMNCLCPEGETPHSVSDRWEFRHLRTKRGGAPLDRTASGESFEEEGNTNVARRRYFCIRV